MCFENKIESLCIQYGFFSKQFNLMTRKCKCSLYKAYYVLESNDEYYYYYYTLL